MYIVVDRSLVGLVMIIFLPPPPRASGSGQVLGGNGICKPDLLNTRTPLEIPSGVGCWVRPNQRCLRRAAPKGTYSRDKLNRAVTAVGTRLVNGGEDDNVSCRKGGRPNPEGLGRGSAHNSHPPNPQQQSWPQEILRPPPGAAGRGAEAAPLLRDAAQGDLELPDV